MIVVHIKTNNMNTNNMYIYAYIYDMEKSGS